ncbi:hypothetical protein TPADAL_0129b [Treponema pallidum subsp. pallidum DAL-1]|nr:hypothetical protein TPADAL_0129b [Treponema pallidum subsp. pallidum DAL-1]
MERGFLCEGDVRACPVLVLHFVPGAGAAAAAFLFVPPYVLWFAPAWTTPLLSLPSQCAPSLLDGATIGCNAPDTSEKLNEPPHSRSPRLRCPALRLSYAPRGWRSRVRSWPC